MNEVDRLQLEKMIQQNDVEDVTDDIRKKKHSKKIRDDVTRMIDMKSKYKRLSKSNPKQYDSMLVSQCSFLFNNYTDIFNRVKKDEIKLETLWELLNVLEEIEEGKLDQHTGSFQVGKLLKSIYIDGAVMKSEKLDKKNKTKSNKPNKVKKISWTEFKKMESRA